MQKFSLPSKGLIIENWENACKIKVSTFQHCEIKMQQKYSVLPACTPPQYYCLHVINEYFIVFLIFNLHCIWLTGLRRWNGDNDKHAKNWVYQAAEDVFG